MNYDNSTESGCRNTEQTFLRLCKSGTYLRRCSFCFESIQFKSIGFSNVPADCPVMCDYCKANGSPGELFTPAPATQLIGGDGTLVKIIL